MLQVFFVIASTLLALLTTTVGSNASDTSASAQVEKQSQHTRVVLRFDSHDGVEGIEHALVVLRARLKELGAAEVSVERKEASDVVVEFKSPPTGVPDKESELIRSLTTRGDLCFYIEAGEAAFAAMGKDPIECRKRASDWLNKPENAQLPISVYNALPEAEGGPPDSLRWFTHRPDPNEDVLPSSKRRLSAVMVPKPEWTFTSADLYSASEAVDTLDFPAISFQLRPKATDRFGEFTGAHVKEQMAIVFDDEIVSCATIIEKLPGQAQISGRFTEQQVKAMITVLRSGELPSKPALVSIEQVPARH